MTLSTRPAQRRLTINASELAALRDELLASSSAPSTSDCALLGGMVRVFPRIAKLYRDVPDDETAALLLLAAQAKRKRLSRKTYELYATILRRHGPCCTNDTTRSIMDEILEAANVAGKNAVLIQLLRSRLENTRDRHSVVWLKYGLAKALLKDFHEKEPKSLTHPTIEGYKLARDVLLHHTPPVAGPTAVKLYLDLLEKMGTDQARDECVSIINNLIESKKDVGMSSCRLLLAAADALTYEPYHRRGARRYVYKGVLPMLDRALKLSRKRSDTNLVELSRGIVLFRLKRDQESRGALNNVSPDLLNNEKLYEYSVIMGKLCEQEGHPLLSTEHFKRAFRLAPTESRRRWVKSRLDILLLEKKLLYHK